MADSAELRKERIKKWLNRPENLIVSALVLFVIVLYMFYFIKTMNQPIWWDEGDYLAIAKVWASGMETPEWWGHFTLMRPLLIPILWAGMFKLSFSEPLVRLLTEVIPAIISIFLIYLLGKGLFNKKVGLIAAFLASVNWVFLFYSLRLFTDSLSLTFSALALYFFWNKYELSVGKAKEDSRALYLAVFFGVLAFLTRYAASLTLIIIAVYLAITRRFSLFKKKNMWMALLVVFLTLTPYFAYNFLSKGAVFPALTFYHGAEATSTSLPFAWSVVTFHLPNFLRTIQTILLVVGIILLLEFVFYIDLIFKKKDNSKNNLLFCFLGVVFPLAYFIFGIRAADARYFISVMPFIFIAVAYALYFIISKASSFLKFKSAFAILTILIVGFLGYQQLTYADSFINSRIDSYKEIKDAGIWLKENTPPDTKVVTASIVQNQYYSERQSYDYYTNDSTWDLCPNDPQTQMNSSCEQSTKDAFEGKLAKINPDYLIVSVFEPYFTPSWMYTYPEEKNLTPIKAFTNSGGQTTLVIYKFNE